MCAYYNRLIHDTRSTLQSVIDRAPPEFAALEDLNLFAQFYENVPRMAAMRARADGCEVRVTTGGKVVSRTIVPKAVFEATYGDAVVTEPLVPGKNFGAVIKFFDETTGTSWDTATVLPVADCLAWPIPVRAFPSLERACDVLSAIVDLTPLDMVGDVEGRERFRTRLFTEIVPTIYSPRYEDARKTGKAIQVFVAGVRNRIKYVTGVLRESRETNPALYTHAVPGRSFSVCLAICEDALDEDRCMSMQLCLPHLPVWPTPTVDEWLRERPPSNACRRCGTKAPNDAKLKLCAGCRCTRYCSRSCQSSDWQRHRYECGVVTKFKAMLATNSHV